MVLKARLDGIVGHQEQQVVDVHDREAVQVLAPFLVHHPHLGVGGALGELESGSVRSPLHLTQLRVA